MNKTRKGMLEILSDLDNGKISDLREVQDFCVKYDVILLSANWTHERGFREPMYFFSDNLGGYTIEAIKSCI